MSDQTQLEENKRVAREYIQHVFNEHRPDLATEYVTSDVVWHGGILGDIAGPANVSGLLSAFIGALPDLYAAEQDGVAENDLVMVRLVVKATQKGDPLGVPAGGTAIQWHGVDIYSCRVGRLSVECAAGGRSPRAARTGGTSPRRSPSRARRCPPRCRAPARRTGCRGSRPPRARGRRTARAASPAPCTGA